MSLFSKKNRLAAEPNKVWETEPEQVVNYNSVVEYLVGLSGDDYTKICQVAAIYRQSDHEAMQVLGLPSEPTTFITPPQPSETTEPSLDDLLIADEPPKKKKAKK